MIWVNCVILLLPLKISRLEKSQSWDRRGTYLMSQCPLLRCVATDSSAQRLEEVLAAIHPCSPRLIAAQRLPLNCLVNQVTASNFSFFNPF